MAQKLLIILISISWILPFTSCKQFLPGKNTEGRMKFIAGTVTLNGRHAALGDAVRFGDVIETGGQSSCEIIIESKNILSLAPNTRLLYRVTTRESNLELSAGGFGAILRNRDATGNMIIKTPTMTASIRGTIFFLKVENPDKTYACVCNGRIYLKPENGGFLKKPADMAGEKLVAATHHEAYYFSREKGAITVGQAGLKYHTDEMMDKDAAAIGETVDWTKIE